MEKELDEVLRKVPVFDSAYMVQKIKEKVDEVREDCKQWVSDIGKENKEMIRKWEKEMDKRISCEIAANHNSFTSRITGIPSVEDISETFRQLSVAFLLPTRRAVG